MHKKGRLWITAGLILIAAALLLTGYNVCTAKRAEKLSASAAESIKESTPAPEDTEIPLYVLNPAMEMPTVELDGREYIGTLEIPALGLTLPVLSEWSYAGLRLSPCRYSGSAYLDDLILCAHNYDGHFGRLKQLSPGDGVSFTDAAGNVFSYRVTALENLQPTDMESMENDNVGLTLFTCTIGGRTRVTVRCEKI